MSARWLAALLIPADIAPHPNFFDEEPWSPAGQFALLLSARWRDYDRWLAGVDVGDESAAFESEAVNAVRLTLGADTVETGLNDLIRLVLEVQGSEDCAAAAGVVASIAMCELDRHSDAMDLLDATLARLRSGSTPEHRLAQAVVLQQLAMRRKEVGEGGLEDAIGVLDTLRGLTPGAFEKFEVSLGVGWTSSRTVSEMLTELRATATQHAYGSRPPWDQFSGWQRIVRSDVPRAQLKVARRALAGYAAYVEELFRDRIGSRERTFFASDVVAEAIYASYLHAEASGAVGAARQWRSRLGMMRVLRPDRDRIWSRADSLRLFRHAEDSRNLDTTLNDTRAAGPLEALQLEAAQILEQRGDRLTVLELAVLSAASHLLSLEQASKALSTILLALSHGVPATSRNELESLRLERAWRAAVAVAPIAGRVDEVAEALLAAVQNADLTDELVRRGLTQALRDLEWDAVSDRVEVSWARWFSMLESEWASELHTAVPTNLLQSPTPPSVSTIDDVATALNAYLHDGNQISDEAVVVGVELATAAMRAIITEAAAGHHVMRATASPAEVAAGLILYASATQLWGVLTEFVIDPRVMQQEKARALDRLAQGGIEVPQTAATVLARSAESLLHDSAADILGTVVDPFPAALRFLASQRLVNSGDLVVEAARLAASGLENARVEAGRTIHLLWEKLEHAEWMFALGLQLSYDPKPSVRANGGRAIAAVACTEGAFQAVAEQRVLSLLRSDGMVVPLLVLEGLGDSPNMQWSERLSAAVARLAVDHPASGIRIQAAHVQQLREGKPG